MSTVIKQHELNPQVKNEKAKYYNIAILEDGTVVYVHDDEADPPIGADACGASAIGGIFAPFRYLREYFDSTLDKDGFYLSCYVFAKDREEAIKYADHLRLDILAKNRWRKS